MKRILSLILALPLVAGCLPAPAASATAQAVLDLIDSRGVEVRIIMPGIPDKEMAYALAKTYYPALMDAGVRIYEYTPGFVHAKVFVADGDTAVVGTINLDYRSLYHHFECAAYMYKTACIDDIEADFQRTMARCVRMTRERLKAEPLRRRLLGPALKVIAPLL